MLVIPVHTSRRLTVPQRAVLAFAIAAFACVIVLVVSDFPVFASQQENASTMMRVETFGVRTFGVARPTADLRVKPVGVSGADGTVSYTFRVSNAGPDAVTFELLTTTYARPAGSEQDAPTDSSSEHTLNAGQQVDVTVGCETVYVCSSAVAWIDHVNGTDPNTANNLAYVHAQR
jgi:hypothetical protein